MNLSRLSPYSLVGWLEIRSRRFTEGTPEVRDQWCPRATRLYSPRRIIPPVRAMLYWCDRCDREVQVVSSCHKDRIKSYGTCATCSFETRPVCKFCGSSISEY